MRRLAGFVLGWMLVLRSSALSAETGKALVQGTSAGSAVTGTATLTDTPQGLQVSVLMSGVAPGPHGLHIHEFGDCGDAGKAAGGHFNPEGAPHGFLPNDGAAKAHAGDLGNIEIGAGGSGTATVLLPGVVLSRGAHSVGGRAIIVHEKVDDFGQPTGNAGSRVGCGVIVITGQ